VVDEIQMAYKLQQGKVLRGEQQDAEDAQADNERAE